MKFLSDRYEKVYTYKGFDICTLKAAVSSKGDDLGYRIDDKQFDGIDFPNPDDAIKAIKQLIN